MHVNLIDELGRKDRGSRQLIDANGEWAGFQNIPVKTPHGIRCCKALEKPWGYRDHVGTAFLGPEIVDAATRRGWKMTDIGAARDADAALARLLDARPDLVRGPVAPA
jgi:hypothetical protein